MFVFSRHCIFSVNSSSFTRVGNVWLAVSNSVLKGLCCDTAQHVETQQIPLAREFRGVVIFPGVCLLVHWPACVFRLFW